MTSCYRHPKYVWLIGIARHGQVHTGQRPVALVRIAVDEVLEVDAANREVGVHGDRCIKHVPGINDVQLVCAA